MNHNSVSKVLEQNPIFGMLQLKSREDGKDAGFQREEMLRKALWKKGRNGSNERSEIASVAEAGKRGHKGRRPAKVFLERSRLQGSVKGKTNCY